MSEHDEIAKKLVDDVRKRCDDLLTLPDEWSELEDRIAAALAAEREKTKVKTPVRPRSEYHEDCGQVAWWVDDFCESLEDPYIGSPLDTGFDESYQWWSELPDFAPMSEAATSALDAEEVKG